jgi:hypothetical protein
VRTAPKSDAPGDDYQPPDLPLGPVDLAHAITEAAALVRLVVDLPAPSASALTAQQKNFLPDHPDHDQRDDRAHERPGPSAVTSDEPVDDIAGDDHQSEKRQTNPATRTTLGPSPRQPATCTATHTGSIRQPAQLVLRFGTQTDVQAINGGPGGELTPERVAAYIAKYATKSADEFGVGDRRISLDALPRLGLSPHVERIVRTCWDLGAHPTCDGLRRWLHMLGFRGHCASKSRRYSTTLGAIRGERREYRRRQAAEHARLAGEPDPDDESTLVVAHWQFAGLGYLTTGDAALALSAAARAREQRQAARDAAHTA